MAILDSFFYITCAFYSRYNKVRMANMEIGLDSNKSVIKRLWCTYINSTISTITTATTTTITTFITTTTYSTISAVCIAACTITATTTIIFCCMYTTQFDYVCLDYSIIYY